MAVVVIKHFFNGVKCLEKNVYVFNKTGVKYAYIIRLNTGDIPSILCLFQEKEAFSKAQ